MQQTKFSRGSTRHAEEEMMEKSRKKKGSSTVAGPGTGNSCKHATPILQFW